MDKILKEASNHTNNVKIRSILAGGTGATTPETAIQALGGVPISAKGQPNGVTPLDQNELIPVVHLPHIRLIPNVALNGPKNVFAGSSGTIYTITNFDSETLYDVSVNKGSVNRVNNELFFNAPNTVGLTILTINGTDYIIQVDAPYIETPQLIGINNNDINIPLTTTFFASAFHAVGQQDNFTDSQWQLSTEATFTTLVVDSLTGATTVFTPPKLLKETVYYLRVRFNGETIGWSNWSDVINFETMNVVVNYPINEIIKLSRSDLYINYGGGSSVDISADGTVAIMGCKQDLDIETNQTGRVYVYVNVNNSWNLVREIDLPIEAYFGTIGTNGARFGEQVAISDDGQTIIVTASGIPHDNTYSYFGKIYAFRTLIPNDYSTLSLLSIATPVAPEAGYGQKLAISGDANTIIVNKQQNDGLIYYKIINNVLTEIAVLDDIPTDENFGKTISLNTNGNRLIVSAEYGNTNYSGCVYVYDLINDTWVLTGTIIPPDINSTHQFGYCSSVSGDGNTIAISDSYQITSPRIYIYEYINNTWVKRQDFIPGLWATHYGDGTSLSLNEDGTILLIGSPYSNSLADEYMNAGMVHIYHKTTSLLDPWEEISVLSSSDIDVDDEFGGDVVLSSNGSVAIIGAIYSSTPSDNQGGGAYIFA